MRFPTCTECARCISSSSSSIRVLLTQYEKTTTQTGLAEVIGSCSGVAWTKLSVLFDRSAGRTQQLQLWINSLQEGVQSIADIDVLHDLPRIRDGARCSPGAWLQRRVQQVRP
jgi:hypothetical protein